MSSGQIIAALQSATQKPKVISLPTTAKSEETIAEPASSGNSSQDISSKERALYKKHPRPIWDLHYMLFSGITSTIWLILFVAMCARELDQLGFPSDDARLRLPHYAQ